MLTLAEIARLDLTNKIPHEMLRAAYVDALDQELRLIRESRVYHGDPYRPHETDHAQVIFCWLQLDDTLGRAE